VNGLELITGFPYYRKLEVERAIIGGLLQSLGDPNRCDQAGITFRFLPGFPAVAPGNAVKSANRMFWLDRELFPTFLVLFGFHRVRGFHGLFLSA
jgi:hypothetical protein